MTQTLPISRLRSEARSAAGFRIPVGLDARSILILLLISAFPGAASAFTFELFQVSRPDLVVPAILLIEIPFAVWISGFMGAEDRKTIGATFSKILSFDFSSKDPEEIIKAIFWGEDSIVGFIFRIWLAMAAGALVTMMMGQVDTLLIEKYQLPQIAVMAASFTIFSYIFIRNLCEETVMDQIGHAMLTSLFAGALFFGITLI